MLNSRIRNRGLSAKEILLQRGQHTSEQLRFSDTDLAQKQNEIRSQNQPFSAKSKAPGSPNASNACVSVGDLVFIKDECSKEKARDKYILTKVTGNNALVQKLSDSILMSRQYMVPLNRLYPAIPSLQSKSYDRDHKSVFVDSDDSSLSSVERGESIGNNSDLSATDTVLEELLSQDKEENIVSDRRSYHQRRPPQWIRSGLCDMEH